MNTLYCTTVFLVIVIIGFVGSSPIADNDGTSDYNDDYYGDFTDSSNSTKSQTEDSPPDLLRIGAGALNSFLGILGAKISFLRSLLEDKTLQKQVGDTLETGVNIARAVITAKAAAIKTASDVAPDVIEGTRSGTRFIGSVIRAANNTAPLVLDGIQELTDQIPLVTGFASAYASVNAEQAQKVANTFIGSFQCDQKCGQLSDADGSKKKCQEEHCKKPEEDNYEDYYDYGNEVES